MTMTALIYLWALSAYMFWLVVIRMTWQAWKRIDALPEAENEQTPGRSEEKIENMPLVSVIVAAKEEEEHISYTVKHLLAQDYPRLEIIAVNDRSADKTGVKLEELKAWSKREANASVPLHVIHITRLPERWLGKNHALYQGYLKARGSFLLFTDGDVKMSPDTIRRAVAYAERERLDHLTLMPGMVAPRFWLRAFVHYFLFCLMLVLRPWACNDDRNDKFGIGIGAFNLIRRSAYEKLGTHRAFAMYPDDDLELGRRVKKERMRQRVALAASSVQVEWYPALGAAVRGLEKNLFTGFSYKLSLLLFACAGQLLFFFSPFIVWLFVPWGASVLFLSSAASIIFVYAHMGSRFALRWDAVECAALPVSSALLIGVMIRSAFLALKRGGIYWRGTFYSLGDLKRFR